MSDLISRQDAIDAVNNLTYPSSLMDVKRILVDLPSVQPNLQPTCNQLATEIIRCKDCKHWERDAIFDEGWCRWKQQGEPNWFCADGERRENE